MAQPITRQLPAFKLGKKAVLLPSYVVTLLRKEKQDPHFATFQVPLRFTKFDLRDYLWNLYNLEVKTVRSWVRASLLERRSVSSFAVYRPQAKKYMEVEMLQPFVWPEVPEDLEPWNKALWDAREKDGDDYKRRRTAQQMGKLDRASKQKPSEEREAIAAMAKKLLNGEAKWENGRVLDEKWEAPAVEVESVSDGGQVAASESAPGPSSR